MCAVGKGNAERAQDIEDVSFSKTGKQTSGFTAFFVNDLSFRLFRSVSREGERPAKQRKKTVTGPDCHKLSWQGRGMIQGEGKSQFVVSRSYSFILHDPARETLHVRHYK